MPGAFPGPRASSGTLVDREATLACRRLEANQIQCELKRIWLGRVITQVEVNNPRQAIVQIQHRSKGGNTYRMALVTAQGTVPLTDFYSSDAGADGLASIRPVPA